jgi:hypothetical protein
MAVQLPFIPSVGRYRFVTTIDGTQYGFRVRWNTTDLAWYFDVSEFDGTPIRTGIKIVLGANFARTSNHPLFLDGVMFARSKAEVHSDPTFDNLGTTVQVFYFNRADIVQNMLGSLSEAT